MFIKKNYKNVINIQINSTTIYNICNRSYYLDHYLFNFVNNIKEIEN